ncbi:hypothetical protein BSL78_12457, partial [Apostichopus japonicus]
IKPRILRRGCVEEAGRDILRHRRDLTFIPERARRVCLSASQEEHLVPKEDSLGQNVNHFLRICILCTVTRK